MVMTAASKKRQQPTWSILKAFLVDLDRAGLTGLLQDLHAASKGSQKFLHARFGLGGDVLEPYRTTIDRWLRPDMLRNQASSVATTKKVIANYRKAIGRHEGYAELTVFHCESASGFCNDIGHQDKDYFDALVRMFEQALKAIDGLPEMCRPPLLERLDAVRHIAQDFGYGVGDDMDHLLARYGVDG
jgi:hypothetical protein